jgi:DNA replication protein DnaC
VIPDTVEADLAACYQSTVEGFGCNFKPTPDTARILKATANWLKKGKSGLLLTGSVGTGKTKLMQAISLLIGYYTFDETNDESRQGLKIYSAPKICELASSNEERESVITARIKTLRYVGIDDLGTEPLTVKNWGTELSPVINTLYERYDKQLVTVITTNDGLETLRKKYGERIHDRICEQYDRITFNFKSFRI